MERDSTVYSVSIRLIGACVWRSDLFGAWYFGDQFYGDLFGEWFIWRSYSVLEKGKSSNVRFLFMSVLYSRPSPNSVERASVAFDAGSFGT